MTSTKSVAMEINSIVDEYDFTWKIKNFSRHYDSMESAVFTPLSNVKTEFSVSIQFVRNQYLNCYILLKKLNAGESLNDLRMEYHLKFINAEDSVVLRQKTTHSVSFNESEHILQSLGVDTKKYSIWNNWGLFNLEKRPSDDTVILKIHFEFFGHNVTTTSIIPSLTKAPRQNLSILSTDFINIYTSKALTDITIQIDGTFLQAHQTVLVARSPVFKTMLQSSCLESESKCLTITEVDYDVFDCFLKYLYSGVLEDQTFSNVYRLYSVADKYEVFSLHEECGEILASNLSTENVCSVLKLSYLHSDESLKDKAIYFMSSSFSEIKSNPEWNEILKNYPELASEVLGSLFAGFKI